jgi:hypothetical protein
MPNMFRALALTGPRTGEASVGPARQIYVRTRYVEGVETTQKRRDAWHLSP